MSNKKWLQISSLVCLSWVGALQASNSNVLAQGRVEPVTDQIPSSQAPPYQTGEENATVARGAPSATGDVTWDNRGRKEAEMLQYFMGQSNLITSNIYDLTERMVRYAHSNWGVTLDSLEMTRRHVLNMYVEAGVVDQDGNFFWKDDTLDKLVSSAVKTGSITEQFGDQFRDLADAVKSGKINTFSVLIRRTKQLQAVGQNDEFKKSFMLALFQDPLNQELHVNGNRGGKETFPHWLIDDAGGGLLGAETLICSIFSAAAASLISQL